MNGLKLIFKERCINVSEFAKKIEVPRTTLYNALNNSADIGRMGIDLFLKICDGLDEEPREFFEDVRAHEIQYAVVTLEGEEDD